MATQKPISTISYNTEAFLKEKLEEWLDAHIIQSYMYIKHKGEEGGKDHIHLRIEPNRRLDPMDLTEALKEYTGKPLLDIKGRQLADEDGNPMMECLSVRPWRNSKEEDWVLYALHDEQYMRIKYGDTLQKGEKIPYSIEHIKHSPLFDMEDAFTRARASLRHNSVNMAMRLKEGDSPLKLIQDGSSPFLVNAVMRATIDTDYGRLQQAYIGLKQKYDEELDKNAELEFKLKLLCEAITQYGLDVEIDSVNQKYILKPR